MRVMSYDGLEDVENIYLKYPVAGAPVAFSSVGSILAVDSRTRRSLN